jgi:acyl homoserine lactone synthase
MVYAVNIRNDHTLGGLIYQQYELRHESFIERQSYDVPTFDGMEYDKYDTPATNYLVWVDEGGIVRGVSRKAPTDRAYMIKDIWPALITKMPLPNSTDIWESSRFAVDKNLSVELRRQIIGDLVCAGLEFGLRNGIKGYVGVMPPGIWRSVFERCGWPIEKIGAVVTLDSGERIVPGWMEVKEEYLEQVKHTMQIHGCSIQNNCVVRKFK